MKIAIRTSQLIGRIIKTPCNGYWQIDEVRGRIFRSHMVDMYNDDVVHFDDVYYFTKNELLAALKIEDGFNHSIIWD